MIDKEGKIYIGIASFFVGLLLILVPYFLQQDHLVKLECVDKGGEVLEVHYQIICLKKGTIL